MPYLDPVELMRSAAEYQIRIYTPNRKKLLALLGSNFVGLTDIPGDGINTVFQPFPTIGPVRKAGFFRLEYVLNDNESGGLSLDMPAIFPSTFIERDTIIEVWRSSGPFGGTWNLEGDRLWLVNKVVYTGGAAPKLSLSAEDLMTILKRRIVDYASGIAQSDKSTNIDLIIRQLINENLGPGATNAQRTLNGAMLDWSANNVPFYVEVPLGQLGVSMTRASYQNLWDVIKEQCDVSAQRNVYCAMRLDFTPGNDSILCHLVVGPTGGNRTRFSGNPLILSEQDGSLKDVVIVRDYTSEYNVVRLGGAGEGANRILGWAYDSKRALAGPFTWTEFFLEDTQIDNPSLAAIRADAALRNGRPIIRFTGAVSETDKVRYGLDYRLGTLVSAVAEEQYFDCRIDQVHVTVEKGETVEARLVSDDSVLL